MQYYNLIHLGFSGYREVMENCLANARILSKSLEATGWYTCLSDIHRPEPNKPSTTTTEVKDKVMDAVGAGKGNETSADYIAGLPVVSFRLTDEFHREFPHIKQETVSLLLRARQWIIPNYALPPNEDKTEILRVVIRESMSLDLLDRLVTDIVQVTEQLMENDELDLSILSKQKRGPSKKGDRHKDKGKKHGGKVGDEVKRMADGIHRSVC